MIKEEFDDRVGFGLMLFIRLLILPDLITTGLCVHTPASVLHTKTVIDMNK